MRSRSLAGLVACSLWLVASTAHAATCTVSSDRGATVRMLDPTSQADANLIVSMTRVPKLMHLDYAAASKRAGCSLGALPSTDPTYELWGDDKGSRSRKAISATKGAPVAILVPIFDILKQLQQRDKRVAAQVDGYLLATIRQTGLTGWRYYGGMPDADTLKRDMAEVLSAPRGNPIFSTGADGKINLYLPQH